jgi:hypothetical protein
LRGFLNTSAGLNVTQPEALKLVRDKENAEGVKGATRCQEAAETLYIDADNSVNNAGCSMSYHYLAARNLESRNVELEHGSFLLLVSDDE